ncbi:MAG: thiamine pyrophosphate-dependent dehydrogenase E1 component subunit alpha [Gammaproteobacteria bacterium]|nr:thiamine pyrophosphate-dependent dehydrogenase E1 component subunit alpha [Gammaproteobacteria bacterium]
MSESMLLQQYRSLYRIRRVEEVIAAHYREQQMRCPVHLSIGQEAVAVGVCTQLHREDALFSGHRAHAHYLAKGGDLQALFAELYGKATGCCSGRGGSMHLIDLAVGFWGATPIVAGTVPLAVGVALAWQLQGRSGVSAVFIGDGAMEEGVVHESLNYAAQQQLAVLFICENNGYAVYTRLAGRQPPRQIHALAAAHGLTVAVADGNDVELVSQHSAAAVAAMRQGGGPQFLELTTHRWLEHCGPDDDDHLGYRQPGELAAWRERCPLALAAERLQVRDAVSEATLVQLRQQVEDEIAAALEAAQNAPEPDGCERLEHLYGE